MKIFLRQFLGRNHGPLAQFIKYGIAGVIATIVHIVFFYAMGAFVLAALEPGDPLVRWLGLRASDVTDAVRARHSIINNVAAFMVSNLTAYLLNIGWVFESGRHHRALEVLFFYAVSAVSILVGSALMGHLIHAYGVSTTMAFGANVAASLLINYVLRKHVIFKR